MTMTITLIAAIVAMSATKAYLLWRYCISNNNAV